MQSLMIMHAVYVLDHSCCRSDTFSDILLYRLGSRNGLYGLRAGTAELLP